MTLLTLGSVFTTFIGERISDLKLGNGTSLLIFTSIISYLPASFGRTVAQAFQDGNYVGLITIILSFFLLVLGIVYVQVSEFSFFKIYLHILFQFSNCLIYIIWMISRKLSAKYPWTMLLDTAVELGDFNDLHIYHLRFETSYNFIWAVSFAYGQCDLIWHYGTTCDVKY